MEYSLAKEKSTWGGEKVIWARTNLIRTTVRAGPSWLAEEYRRPTIGAINIKVTSRSLGSLVT